MAVHMVVRRQEAMSWCASNPLLMTNQLCFTLSSSLVFCRSDTMTDSEQFYESVLDFLDDPKEKEEVGDLLNWWNW